MCEILNFLVHSERLEETTKNKTDHNNRVITDRLLKASLSSTLDEIRGFFADEPDGGNEHMSEESSPLGSKPRSNLFRPLAPVLKRVENSSHHPRL